jgi:DNA-binding NtrC family response regulator
LRQHAGGHPPALEAKLVEALCLYDWPLNVRELLLLARRLLGVHGHEPVLKKIHLPERMLAPAPALPPEGQAPEAGHAPAPGAKRGWRKIDDEAEFEALVAALRDHDGNVAQAAAALGVSRARAYRLLAAHPEFSIEELRR